jgi:hypothetical protein
MKLVPTITATLFLCGPAWGADVYVTTDSSGNRVYTDRPQTLPAERITVRSSPADAAAARDSNDAQTRRESADATKSVAAEESPRDKAVAEALSSEDRAKRCVEARQRYQRYMEAVRLYEVDADGQRQYLDASQIDSARANAKTTMDEFCSPQ